MFNSSNINSFKHLLMLSKRAIFIGDAPFVFYEDTNEFASIIMQPYQISETYANGHDELVKVAVANNNSFFISGMMMLLHTAIGLRYYKTHFEDLFSAYSFIIFQKNVILLTDAGMSVSLPLPYNTMGHYLYFILDNNTYSATFFLQTFSISLWTCFICFSISIFGCMRMVVKLLKQRFITLIEFISLTLGNSITDVNLTTITFHILFVSLLILLIIFYAAFGAFLNVLLAIKKVDLPFNSIYDLLSRPDYTLCVLKYSATHGNVAHLLQQVDGKVTINSEYCPTANTKSNNWIPDNTFECSLQKMAFIFTEKETDYEKLLIKKCNLVKYPGNYFNVQLTFLISLEFHFKEIFNQKIILARTSGNVDYLTNTAYFTYYPPPINPSEEHKLVEIEFQHCKLMILFLLIGMFASLFILAAEILWRKISKQMAAEHTNILN